MQLLGDQLGGVQNVERQGVTPLLGQQLDGPIRSPLSMAS
jgi:hypothetical protein